MKNLSKNTVLLMVGTGVLTFLAVRYYYSNKNKETVNKSSVELKSNVGGCGCGG